MQFRSLRYFIEVARAGSFYGAAKVLGVSQQGLSRSVSALEEELGCVLLERGRRGVSLTGKGELLLEYASKIVELHDLMLVDMSASKSTSPGQDDRIKVFVSYYSAQIAAADPDYVRVLSHDACYIEEPFEKLMKRAATSDGTDLIYLDLHPHSFDEMLQGFDVEFCPTLKTRYGLLWKKGSKFAGLDSLDIAEAACMPIAVNTFREIAQYTEWLFRDCPLEDVRMGSTSSRMLVEYVKSSDSAVALFDSFSYFLAKEFQADTVADLGFTPFSTPESVCSVGFVFPKGTSLSARAQRSITLLSNMLEKKCAEYFREYPND